MSFTVFKKATPLLLLFFVSCGQQDARGPLLVQIVKSRPGHCSYEIAPVALQTVESLLEMRGTIGRVAYSTENLGSREEILDMGDGLRPIDANFSKSGDVYGPLDTNSLFAASLYYGIETGYLLFKRLDPMADLATVVPNFNQTTIVHDTRRSFGKVGVVPEVSDNAEYLHHESESGGVRNYFFSYPTDEVKDIPLGINAGVMVHEYSHMVFHYLFFEKAFAKNTKVASGKPTSRTAAALDEGMADYFGYLAVQDPGFFLCSYPNQDRDLAVPKSFTSSIAAAMSAESDEYFDSHEGGAVWASIQYEIGKAIGEEENARSLVRLMPYLLECPDATVNGALGLDFGVVAKCHQRLLNNKSAATAIYNKYLGVYGGGR